MDINIQKYTAFLKTVEYGSFTKAAERLNYSQSGISRMIADLENDWKVSLLERSKGGVRLTSDGKKLLPHIKDIVAEYERLRFEIDELNGLQSGLIRIGTFSSAACHWLPNIIKEFQKDYPNIEYELLLGDYSEIEEWIADGSVDCGLLRLPTRQEFDSFFLEKDKLMVVVPENHRLASFDKIPVDELCGEPFMLQEKGTKSEVYEIFEKRGLSPDVKFTTWDDYAIMSMVENGLGISILPQLILNRIPYNIAVKELDVPAYRNIGLALRSKKNASIAVRRFSEYLRYRQNG
ncbi:MAG: LysR family transcriptional regulator [Clostridia bacterium]|nr:LysR family transcriptional regulator [Clostridia bacterium]